MIDKEVLNQCGDFILKEGRLLEKELYKHFFIEDNTQNVLQALLKYQNEDGGFGHGLEPDALLPLSSPFQTTVALAHLKDLDKQEEALIIIEQAIHYLESQYNKKRHGWFALPKEVNEYPHTIWWEFDEKKQMTAIDEHYGNPTAEVIAYLVRYKQYVRTLDVDDLVNYMLEYIENIELFQCEHELYCFIALYHELDGHLKERLKKQLSKAVHQLVEYNQVKWKTEYVPTPLSFVKHPTMIYFGIDKTQIDFNLDYLVQELTENHKITPSWGSNFYEGNFKKSFSDWIAIQTLETLIILKNFNRI
ncbi:hypothetical protein KHQ81_05135 [Mycoplasmatota bacterium]|nr:hypothetical protein KHQ81_05135 [Mycoplasmatota bacterium]